MSKSLIWLTTPMQQHSKSEAIGLVSLLAPVKEDNEVMCYRGPRRAPARWGKEEPPLEVKAYLPDTLTENGERRRNAINVKVF